MIRRAVANIVFFSLIAACAMLASVVMWAADNMDYDEAGSRYTD